MAGPIFARVPPELDFPREERETLRFWREQQIFEKTLSKPAPNGSFVFYEGPPTANGLPHNGHVLTRVIKDLFPRYKTMRGWSVPRKAGWDTHGLPVEVEVEKELRIHGKAAIEEYGVEPFVKKCIASVFRYTKEWEELTNRVAFWADLNDAYVTYHRSYIESVWWALGELHKKGLLYQGHKVVWWWAQGGTALSANEVGQGYRTVDDPSVYVAFPITKGEPGKNEENVSLLVWTTTPWTLPSNMYAAVHPELDYAIVRTERGRRFVIAVGLVDSLSKKLGELVVEKALKGKDLEGWEYAPPFDAFQEWNFELPLRNKEGSRSALWRIVLAPFVTIDAGTGIVHIAPAFGEDDHDVFRRELGKFSTVPGQPSLRMLCAVKADGSFLGETELPNGETKPILERYAGRWVKDCDKEISHDLKDKGLLVHAEPYRHEYPFCWRADTDPLIQYARPAWYIRTTAHIDRAIANNQAVHWLPEHIKDGRFGDFLANNVDWALSRERWWGTPLNVWVCNEDPNHQEVPASIAAIEKRNANAFAHFHAARRADPTLSEHLIVHKPWIDQVTMPCARCSGTMRRVPEVIDCWFDSGCMPFAQWGYPHASGSKEQFAKSFPADFISEAIDQTRGWFYSLLMISTLIFDDTPYPNPYKTCIVLGHVTDKEGKKESKSKGNYTPPEIILDKVAMEFAVLGDDNTKQGVALIGRDDLEGLDLQEGSRVLVYRADVRDQAVELVLQVGKKLRRRLVVLHADDRAKLGVLPTSTVDVPPVGVPRLPAEERVVIEDPLTPAPGADAFRWFFYASSPPWSATRHSLSNVRALQKDFAVKLRNVYSFFTIYSNIDHFNPKIDALVEASEAHRVELDRWILSELALTVRAVTDRMDAYDCYGATQRLVAFVDALSNWYVRRSRKRFWKSGLEADKRSAYETLHRCLVTLAKLTAPFTPYASEAMYQNLVVRPGIAGARESVHLEDWPSPDAQAVDASLSNKIAAVRALASLGLQVRNQAKIKVRQPISKAHIITTHLQELDASVKKQLAEELNADETTLVSMDDAAQYVEFRLKPNFRSLGQRGLGKEAQALKKTMASMPSALAGDVASTLMGGRSVTLDGVRVELSREDVEIEFVAKEGFAAAGDRVGVVVLDTRIDGALLDRGLLNELVNRVQAARKELGLEYTDRIRVSLLGSARVRAVVTDGKDLLEREVLALHVSTDAPVLGGYDQEVDVDGETVRVGVFHESQEAHKAG
jgi:isoleucyl-tRNA synthetase